MPVKTTALVVSIAEWSARQDLNLDLYLERWLSRPGDRDRSPYDISFDPTVGRGKILYRGVVIGEFRLVGGNDYTLDWIRSVEDSETLGRFGLEGLSERV